MDWTSIGAGVGAGLSELGHGRSYLDEEERKRRAREAEIAANKAERESVAQQQHDTEIGKEAIRAGNDQAKIQGAKIDWEQGNRDLEDVLNNSNLTDEQKTIARLERRGVKLPTPTTRVPSVQRVDTVDPKTGRHVVKFVPTEEAAGQQFDAYDAPKTPPAEALVRVETTDANGDPVVQFVPRSEAAGQSFKKPPKAADGFDKWLEQNNKEKTPPTVPQGGSSVLDQIKMVARESIPGLGNVLDAMGRKSSGSPAQPPAPIAPSGRGQGAGARGAQSPDVLSMIAGTRPSTQAPAAAPSADLAAKARAVLQQHGKDTSDAAVAAFLKNPANVKALGGG